jgi:hypothetical protein
MNCSYCNSKIFETDKTCSRCGAPNITNFNVGDNDNDEGSKTFGQFIAEIERYDPKDISLDVDTETYLDRYCIRPLRNFFTGGECFKEYDWKI